ncbi:MAG: ABC transporter ATP-binding protein [Planctomycetota bacterium]
MAAVLEVRDLSLRRGEAGGTESAGGIETGKSPDFAVRLPALRLQKGRVVALYGPSGCGKTSMLEAALGLFDRPGWQVSEGDIRIAGQKLRDISASDLLSLRQRRIAFLMQDAQSALDPLMRVRDQVRALTPAKTDAQVHEMLARLGVDDPAGVAEREPHRISGGQAQRVLLAIAFLRQPALVVADEPSASLDGGSYLELRNRLRELVAGGSALLLATHDHRLLDDLSADVLVVRDGAFVRGKPEQCDWPERPEAEVGSMPLVQCRNVRVAYGERVVLDSVDFALPRGEIVALLGESGAGKTTLLRVLAGHRSPDSGEVTRPERSAALQLVCQDVLGALTPGRRLQAMLAEAHAPFFEPEQGAESVQLDPDVLQRTAAEMSGGERRRAALLRAMAVHPDALLLDEPTASLDRASAVSVISTLLELHRSRGLSIVLATHDESLARAVAHRRLRLEGGELCELW